jgi:hypothetical protein
LVDTIVAGYLKDGKTVVAGRLRQIGPSLSRRQRRKVFKLNFQRAATCLSVITG